MMRSPPAWTLPAVGPLAATIAIGAATALLATPRVGSGDGAADGGAAQPAGLYLTWQRDPTTTMSIDWHTAPDDEAEPILRYKRIGDDTWSRAPADRHAFPFSDRTIHRVELTGLEPATGYHFRVGEFERRFKFRTLPASLDDRPVTFAAGGDVRHTQEMMERTNAAVMEYDPDFIAWGGDLAYADGMEQRVGNWYEWFDAILNTLVTAEGRVVPILVGIGNHEGPGYTHRIPDLEPTDESRARHYPYFFSLFAFPGQPGYNVLDFGEYMSFIMLDSMHANEPRGEQEQWLLRVLEQRRGVPYVFPKYHVAGWASVKGIKYRYEQGQVRAHFHPHFEEHGVRVAFENHDHAYKRTPPMRGNEPVEGGEGTVYLGDGAWGVSVREHVYHVDKRHIEKYDFDTDSRNVQWSETFDTYIVRARDVPEDYPYTTELADIPYLEAFASVRHGIVVRLEADRATFTAVSEDGEVIDEYSFSPGENGAAASAAPAIPAP